MDTTIGGFVIPQETSSDKDTVSLNGEQSSEQEENHDLSTVFEYCDSIIGAKFAMWKNEARFQS
ncbi:MAG: hypothetical protein ACYTEL_21280 [Planctomycetota bacterium]|jgi:hypothetical protein